MGGLPTTTINGFAADPTNSELMYVGTREGLFRTEDAGKTWKPVSEGPKNVAAVTVNPKQPQEVYAATADGTLYRSTDGGKRWGEAVKLAGHAQR